MSGLIKAKGVLQRLRLVTLVAWIALTAAVTLLVPQLETVIARSPNPVVPDWAPSSQTLKMMDVAFGGSGAKSVAFVVLVNEHGLSQADHDYYQHLVATLRADHTNVADVQDIIGLPELKDTLSSKDGKALYIPVGLRGSAGSPESGAQIRLLRAWAADGRPANLEVNVTGLAATFTDLFAEVERSIIPITAITVVLIMIILLVIYRSLITAAIALITIGVALGAARGITAFLGLHAFDVSTFTASFLTAVVLGAGTDYGVFLISRYHELRRDGVPPQEAVRSAVAKVGHVITASAATVAAACGCMRFAKLGLFSTTGPAIAVSVLATLITTLTVTPALLAAAARFGWAEPSKAARTNRLWAGVGALVVRRPVAVLMLGVFLLGALASAYPALRTSFDERAMQPNSTDSNFGYRALAAHYPFNEALPGYLVFMADHDLRNPRDLAALEQAAASVAKVPGVAQVRGVTRPLGTPIEVASLGQQVGQVGQQLSDAQKHVEKQVEEQVTAGRDGISRLSAGAAQMASGAHRLADGARRGLAGIDPIIGGLESGGRGLSQVESGVGQGGDGSRRLSSGAQVLAAALRSAHDQTQTAVDGLELAFNALSGDVLCSVDPVCARVRTGIGEIYRAERDQLLSGLLRAASAADALAAGNAVLADGLQQVRSGLGTARAGLDTLTAAEQRLKDGLGELADGAGRVADGADRVADGADRVSNGSPAGGQSTKALTDGLNQAANFLQTAGKEAADPAVGGFYLPSGAINDPKLALARGYYLSADGKTARLVVLDSTDPLGRESASRVATTISAAQVALRQTSMEGTRVLATGPPAVDADADLLVNRDLRLVAAVAFGCVLLILVLLLRGLVAPLYVLLSVVLSYAAAIGVGVLVSQVLLGRDLEWTVPMITFVVLVAVGADYNILLMTRIREHAPDGARAGIARAVRLTGGVITSAGIIFAASFIAMLSANVVALAQAGFTIGVGLLLDTFVVRTFVVPSIATLLGRHNWWPARRAPAVPAPHQEAPTLVAAGEPAE